MLDRSKKVYSLGLETHQSGKKRREGGLDSLRSGCSHWFCNGFARLLLAVAGGDSSLYHAGAHEIGHQEVAAIGRQEDCTGEAHGAADAHISEYAHQLDDHLKCHKGVRQAHRQREQEEHRLLRHHRMANLAVVAADLCQHTIAAAAVGHVGELLDRQNRRACNDQYKADVDG